ncbi:S-protein homolog 5-like [Vicia villosa]|uniref:S-protein homolog 5-like n=1 Tax=Vicia villosa TaxID=3911 RepID=UPI00273C2BAB|nr:S-protein homolog 5-like [Vicia villosa]
MALSASKIVLSLSMLITIIVSFKVTNGLKTQRLPWAPNNITPHRVYISIINNISDVQLGVHCQDKKHDLGSHSLKFGENYAFDFQPVAFLRIALYFCHFTWDNESHYVDIYNEVRDHYICSKCNWKINKYAPCRTTEVSEICYTWRDHAIEGKLLVEENSTLVV